MLRQQFVGGINLVSGDIDGLRLDGDIQKLVGVILSFSFRNIRNYDQQFSQHSSGKYGEIPFISHSLNSFTASLT